MVQIFMPKIFFVRIGGVFIHIKAAGFVGLNLGVVVGGRIGIAQVVTRYRPAATTACPVAAVVGIGNSPRLNQCRAAFGRYTLVAVNPFRR